MVKNNSYKKMYRKAVFIVTCAVEDGNIFYVILKRHKHWSGWEFPKGGIEKGETMQETVKREIKEETGLKIIKIKKYKLSGVYKYKKQLEDRKGINGQTYNLFLAEVKKGKIKVDKKEHSFGRWVNFNTAIKKLTWPNQKKCLRLINSTIKN